LLLCSLLFAQAYRQVDDLLDSGVREMEAWEWRREELWVMESVKRVFWDLDVGLFLAAATVR
jgi:hypothetical protein